jgi:hypothetical protein
MLFGVSKIAKENDEKAKRSLMIEMGLDLKVEYDRKQFNKVEEEVIEYYQGTSTKQKIYMLVKDLTVINQYDN